MITIKTKMASLLIALLCNVTTFADQAPKNSALTCLSNNKDISHGQTVEKIINICGKPTHKIADEDIQYAPKQTFKWFYYLQLENKADASSNATHLLVKLEVDFFNHQVEHVHLDSSNNSLITKQMLTMLGYAIDKGASENQVKNIFGDPTQITHITTTQTIKTKTVKTVVYFDKDSRKKQTLRFAQEQLINSSISALPENIYDMQTSPR